MSSEKTPPETRVQSIVIHPPGLDDTQPNDGWGKICVGCKHVFADDKKYISMSPAFPCRKMSYTRAGWYWDEGVKRYSRPARIAKLERYVDDTESCSEHEPS